jgi:hypothetical protein
LGLKPNRIRAANPEKIAGPELPGDAVSTLHSLGG